MQIKKTITELENSEKFKEWKKENPECFLAHMFKMTDEPNQGIWQLGYYNEKEGKITTFVIESEEIKISLPSEIFKKPEDKIESLNLDKIMIDWMTALEDAVEFQEKNYPKEKAVKSFFIIQNLNKETIYNITFVTQTFKTLNLKLDANTGEIIDHKLISLFEMGDFQKGEGKSSKEIKEEEKQKDYIQ
jgi:hypothetical protein